MVPLVIGAGSLSQLGEGQCMKSDGNPHPLWIRSYATHPHGKDVRDLKECYADCKGNAGCTAVGFSPAFKKCVLYEGGPYEKAEYWSMYTDFQCHTYRDD